tara:strand:+ start:367 stop:498 length:132 start_codon:yes stop_codon:yes gene_type:complete
MRGYEPSLGLPFPAIELPPGIEPGTSDYKSVVFPIKLWKPYVE